jgi:hypothetical protein
MADLILHHHDLLPFSVVHINGPRIGYSVVAQ